MKQGRLLPQLATALAICTTALASGLACAQEPTEGAVSDQLEQVVITAEKREENLEKAPLAVTAISSDTLRTLGVTTAMDLTQIAPNLTVSQYGSGANVGIRGIVTLSTNEYGDPSTSYSVDGVYFARERAALSGIYDLDRVEVLRGPQGTLEGRDAEAGSINVITNKPDLTQASSTGSIGFGNYDAFSTTAAINMPLSDTFGFRAAADVEQHAGYINDAPNDRRFDDQDSTAGRVHLLWKPTDNLSALFTVDVAHDGGAGIAGNGSGAAIGLYATHLGATPYDYPVQPGPQYLEQLVASETLTLKWSLPFLDVTYIGNHRTDNWTQADDGEILGPEATYCQAVGSAGGGCFHPLINYSVDRQTSHELRFSKDTDRLKWVVGVYYLSEFDSTVQAYEPNSATQWRLIGNPDVYEGSRAAFGQATWSIIERLRLTAGVRQTEDFKQDYGFTELGPYGSINNEQCIGCKVSAINIGKGSWAKTTWHAGIDYDLTPDSLLFAAVSTGYKAGGFNVGAAPANTPYAPESLTNYELGWKSQFLQNRMQVNIDAFFDTMQNYQAAAGTLIDDTNYTLTINAGKAQIKGVELESQFLLTPYDRLTFNATALDAKFTSFYLAHGDGFSPGAQFDPYSLTGKELPYAPHTTARLGYQHTFGLGNAGSLVARADSSYVSHQWLDYHNFTDIAQDEYTRTGLSLTWERSPKFSTQLYVRNLENKAVLAGVQADSAAPGRDFNYYGKNAFYMPPRTYGVRFSASF